MWEIKAVFPHAASLDLTLSKLDHVPCAEIWELWPDLEELKVHVRGCPKIKNNDAEICGVHEEEAENLRGMDDEFLRTVQIVPIRPSLLTMESKYLKFKTGPLRGGLSFSFGSSFFRFALLVDGHRVSVYST